jgi:rod shape determining protein RodA
MRNIFKIDWVLFTSVVLLLGLSLAILFPISYSGENASPDKDHFFRQIIFVGIALVIFWILSFFDYRSLKNYSALLFFLGIFLLLLVLIFGKVIRGTSGWIGFGGFHLQPVEPFKVIIAVALAKYFSVNSRTIKEPRHIFISFVPVLLSIVLILRQPDLGSALVVFAVWFGMLVIAGVKKKYLFILIIICTLVAALSWSYFLKDYQKERVMTLFNPQSDPMGSGYNVIQSTVAVGSGGIWGKGLGHGSQSQLNFLPEKHTDFIFAVVSEELGLGGATFVLALFSVIIFRLIKSAQNSRDNFGKLMASAVAIIVFVQIVINLGMNIGILPVAGIPLPLMSYGGSSLLSMLAALGIAENIYRVGQTG